MNRPVPLVLTLLALALASPSAASADPFQILEDCQDGRIDKKYSNQDLRAALRDLPPDLDEYTNCREVIRSALQGVRGGGGSGPGSQHNDAGGYGALPAGEGGLPLGPDGRPIDPRGIASEEERVELDRARLADGATVVPKSAGIAPGDGGAGLPTPLLVVLVLIAAGALTGLVPRVRELVRRRSA